MAKKINPLGNCSIERFKSINQYIEDMNKKDSKNVEQRKEKSPEELLLEEKQEKLRKYGVPRHYSGQEMSKEEIIQQALDIKGAVERKIKSGEIDPEPGVPYKITQAQFSGCTTDLYVCHILKALADLYKMPSKYVYVGMGQNATKRPNDHLNAGEFDPKGYIFAINMHSNDNAIRIEDLLGGVWEDYLGFKFNDHLPSATSAGERHGDGSYIYIGLLSEKERKIADRAQGE